MLRTALLALALALGGGTPYFGSFVHLVTAAWTAQADAGSHYDPNGTKTDAGNHADPNGGTDTGDAGGHFDPNG